VAVAADTVAGSKSGNCRIHCGSWLPAIFFRSHVGELTRVLALFFYLTMAVSKKLIKVFPMLKETWMPQLECGFALFFLILFCAEKNFSLLYEE
jgi:hypothetical protein